VALLHTLTTTGTCVQTTATGVITVNPIAAISLTSGQVQIIKQMYKCCHTISLFAISGGELELE
jgi:hypothetical protein